MKTVAIEVTRDDINAGVKFSPSFCPVARAIRRHVIPSFAVYVNPRLATAVRYGDERRHEMPVVDAAHDFILQFDSGKRPAPFAFALDMPEEILP